MARQRLWLAIATVVLATACTIGPGPTADPSTTPGASSSGVAMASASAGTGEIVIAWNPGTPPPVEAPPASAAPVGIPPCGTDQLQARPAHLGGAGGSMAGGFLFRNVGPVACALVGRPTLALVGGDGRRLPVREAATDEQPTPIVLAANVALPADGMESPVGLGSVFIVWSNWCGRAPKQPLALRMTGPDGGVLAVPMDQTSLPRCDEPQAPSTISVGPFAASPGPDPTDPPAIPAESLRLTLVVPDHAVAGQVLSYVASLANPTASPIPLEPCPTFEERLNTHGGPVVVEHVLACESVPIIAAGASVPFAMELAVPVGLPADPDAALVWSLDPFHAQGFAPRAPEAKVRMPVVLP